MSYDHTKEAFDKLAEVAPFWHGALTACVRDGLTTAQTRNVLVKCAQADPVLLEEFNEISAQIKEAEEKKKKVYPVNPAALPPEYTDPQTGMQSTNVESRPLPGAGLEDAELPFLEETPESKPQSWIQKNIASANAEVQAKQQRQLDAQMIQQQEQLRLRQQEAAMPYRRYEGWLNWDKSQLWRVPHMFQSLGEGAWSLATSAGSGLGALGTTPYRLMEEAGRATGVLSQGQTTFKNLQEDYAGRGWAHLKSTGQDVGNIASGGELRNRYQYDEADKYMQQEHGYRYDKSLLVDAGDIDWLEQTDRWAQGLGSFAFEMVMPSAALRAVNKGRQALRGLRGLEVAETAHGGSKALTLGRRGADLVDEGLLAAREAGKLGENGATTYRAIKKVTTEANKRAFQGKDATKLLDDLGVWMANQGVHPTVTKNLLRNAGDATRQAAGLQTVNNTMKALRASGEISDDAFRVWKTLTPSQRAAQAAYPTMAKLAEKVPAAQKLLKFIPGAGLGEVNKGSYLLRNLDRMQLLKNMPSRGAALRIPGKSSGKWFDPRGVGVVPHMFREGGLTGTSGHSGLLFGPGTNPARTVVPGVREGARGILHGSGVVNTMEHVGFMSGGLARKPLEMMGRIPVLHTVSDVMLSTVPKWYQRALQTVSMGRGPTTRGSLGVVPGVARWPLEAQIGLEFGHQGITGPGESRHRRNSNIPTYNTHDPVTGREYSPYEQLAQHPYGFRRGWDLESGAEELHPEMDTGGRRALFNTQQHTGVSLKFKLPPDHFRIGLERHLPENLQKQIKTQQIAGSSLLPTDQLNIHDEYLATYLLLNPRNTDFNSAVLPAYAQALSAYRSLTSDTAPAETFPTGHLLAGQSVGPAGTGGILSATTPQSAHPGSLGGYLPDGLNFRKRTTPLKVPADSVPAAQHLAMQVVMPVHDRMVMERVGVYYTNAFKHWQTGTSDASSTETFMLKKDETVWDDSFARSHPELVKGIFDPASPAMINGSGNHINVWHNATWHARFEMARMSAESDGDVLNVPELVQKQLYDAEGQQWWAKADNFYKQMKQWEDAERARMAKRFAAVDPGQLPSFIEKQMKPRIEAKFIELMPPIESFRYKGRLYKRPEGQRGQPAAALVPIGGPGVGSESLPGIGKLLEVSAPTP